MSEDEQADDGEEIVRKLKLELKAVTLHRKILEQELKSRILELKLADLDGVVDDSFEGSGVSESTSESQSETTISVDSEGTATSTTEGTGSSSSTTNDN